MNLITYLKFLGYTFHQGSFLHVTAEGNVVLDRDLDNETMKVGNRQLSARRAAVRDDVVSHIEKCDMETDPPASAHMHQQATRQGPREMLRDVSSE
jgi:solute carrier family 30 (zinc transporter), member 1